MFMNVTVGSVFGCFFVVPMNVIEIGWWIDRSVLAERRIDGDGCPNSLEERVPV
jgi:hypothetical protein